MNDRVTVSFPNMGFDINISRVAFTVLNTPIYWYGIIIAAAFLVCVVWAMRDSKRFGLIPETVIDLMLFAAPVAIICARLYYVIFSWENYRYDLKQIFNIRNGGLAILGGIIGAVITAYFVARYKKIPVFKFFDFAIPYVALGQAIGRWGNFFNQEASGTNTDLPWGMTSPVIKSYLSNKSQELQASGITVYPDLPVHPTFLYESIWDIGVFVLLYWMRKKKKFDGEVFCLYFVTYGLGRAFIEGLRTDSLMLGNLRISQLLSVIFFIAFGIFIIYKRMKLKNSAGEVPVGQSGYADILKIMEEESKDTSEAAEADDGETAAEEAGAELKQDPNLEAGEAERESEQETGSEPETEGPDEESGNASGNGEAEEEKKE